MHVEFPPLFIHPSATEYPASTRSHGLRRTVDLGRVGPPWCRGHMHRRQSRPSYFEKPRRSRGLHLPFKSVHSERCRFPVASSLVKPSRLAHTALYSQLAARCVNRLPKSAGFYAITSPQTKMAHSELGEIGLSRLARAAP